jgi:uncharacterized membrane protein/YHS domain-containing protein
MKRRGRGRYLRHALPRGAIVFEGALVMVSYLVGMVHAFVPTAWIAGLLMALAVRPLARREVLAGVWCVVFGMAAGSVLHGLAGPRGHIVEMGTALGGWAIGCALATLVAVALRGRAGGRWRTPVLWGGLVVLASFAAQAMFHLAERLANQRFTATAVLNTELVLNTAAVLAGVAAIILLVVLVAHAGRLVRRGATALLIAGLAVQGAVWTAEVMLGLLQMRVLDVTAWRVSFVARATDLMPLAVYLQLALVAVLAALVAYANRPRAIAGTSVAASTAGETDRPARRKIAAAALAERRWLRGMVATAGFLVAVLLYHDLYASRPPALSPATTVTADEAGTIRLHIDAVKDGLLHRYAYISNDGHRVRFFLINRYDADHVKIGVVFDACTICGDSGYIQEGHEVMCASCNVRIFVPSIGKPGGCNPIPLPHEEEAGSIVIAAAELEQGARYFSEVVALTVPDPVTGATLVNRTAPFRYEHEGKTFYFAGRESYEAFRADPDRYTAGK